MNRPLVATARVQLIRDRGFDAVAAHADHYVALGVSHVYLSPVFEARPGSEHGYDVVDPTAVRAELGGRAGLDRLAATLHQRDLGIVLDIVPNHLAADPHNPWWWAVLRDGRASPHASVFDVDWDAGDDRILLPVLGAPLDEVLAQQGLAVVLEGEGAHLRYGDRVMPLAPGSDPLAPLPDLLAQQHYELRWWRNPDRNVRRFFDIDDLVGVRVEDPEVFTATHALVVELVEAGIVDALRVDHVDGLRDPAAYLDRLAAAVPVPILVEKILGPDEELPAAWPVIGTTGYEHLARLDQLFVDRAGLRALDAEYRAAGGAAFPTVDRDARAEALDGLFPSEVGARGAEAARLLDAPDPDGRTAVTALTLALDVYRTYLTAGTAPAGSDRDRLTTVRERVGSTPPAADLADRLLAGDDAALEWAARWQQLSGAVMAKGHEDTAYYRHARLLALNEVGGDPDAPLAGDVVERWHSEQAVRLGRGRPGLTATTTHDTKRSEDARSRLLALTEIPTEWLAGLGPLLQLAPDGVSPDEVRFVAQTLLASWPLHPRGWDGYEDRVVTALRKSLREAKLATSWRDPDEFHEARLLDWVGTLLAEQGAAFDRHLGAVRARIEPAAAVTSLTRLLLKHTAPGVPDLYRGTESWALDLVDPDNRRPLDPGPVTATLEGWRSAPPTPDALRRTWRDGRIKLWCTARSLAERRSRPDLYALGRHERLPLHGDAADALVGAVRRDGDEWAVVVGARRSIGIAGPDGWPVGPDWAGTRFVLPDGAPTEWRNVLDPDRRVRGLADALAVLPVALLRPA